MKHSSQAVSTWPLVRKNRASHSRRGGLDSTMMVITAMVMPRAASEGGMGYVEGGVCRVVR
jgi:hypothetical protein